MNRRQKISALHCAVVQLVTEWANDLRLAYRLDYPIPRLGFNLDVKPTKTIRGEQITHITDILVEVKITVIGWPKGSFISCIFINTRSKQMSDKFPGWWPLNGYISIADNMNMKTKFIVHREESGKIIIRPVK